MERDQEQRYAAEQGSREWQPPARMRTAVFDPERGWRIERREIPSIGEEDVLLRVRAAVLEEPVPHAAVFSFGAADSQDPSLPAGGRMFAGDIVRIGSRVSRVQPGDRAAAVPFMPCRSCTNCEVGEFRRCAELRHAGLDADGGYAAFVRLPAANVVRLPVALSYREGALFEPAAAALSAVRQLDFNSGHAAVFGTGLMGLLLVQWLRILGADSVTVFGDDNDCLDHAARIGADHTIHLLGDFFADQVRGITEEHGFRALLDTTGTSAAAGLCLEWAADEGMIGFAAAPLEPIKLSPHVFNRLRERKLTVTGAALPYGIPFPGDTWELAGHFAASGRLELAPLIGAVIRASELERHAVREEAGADGTEDRAGESMTETDASRETHNRQGETAEQASAGAFEAVLQPHTNHGTHQFPVCPGARILEFDEEDPDGG